MARSNTLPSDSVEPALENTPEAWIPIIQHNFRLDSQVIGSRFRWISRIGDDGTPKDYVLEDQGEFLLLSIRYAPNLYVRASIKDLIKQKMAMNMYSLILAGQWDNPKLKQVLVRVGDRSVPLQAVVMNISRRHNFTPDDVMTIVSRAQAEASWFLADRKRRRRMATLNAPDIVMADSTVSILDTICRGEAAWIPQKGEVMVAYYRDPDSGAISTLRYSTTTGTVEAEHHVKTPTILNPVSVARYRSHLRAIGVPSLREDLEDALDSMVEHYKDHLHEMENRLLNIE